MTCARLPSLIAALPGSVGICTFINMRMVALLAFGGPTGARGERVPRRCAPARRRTDHNPNLTAGARGAHDPTVRPSGDPRQGGRAAAAGAWALGISMPRGSPPAPGRETWAV